MAPEEISFKPDYESGQVNKDIRNQCMLTNVLCQVMGVQLLQAISWPALHSHLFDIEKSVSFLPMLVEYLTNARYISNFNQSTA